MAGLSVRELGDYIREQRHTAQVSLRQLAKLAGVSNPYLSQIERGLRRPSAEILQQIARALRISAETLYVQAGILDEREGGDVVEAINADRVLDERQKRVLVDIYRSFLTENATHPTPPETSPAATPAAGSPAPTRTEPTGGSADANEE
ncbi:MAG TPA: helix-turn-helix transcriptional regulator [Mycobacteriales bacterium]